MHECQEIRSANINQKEDRFLIYERDLLNYKIKMEFYCDITLTNYLYITFCHILFSVSFAIF